MVLLHDTNFLKLRCTCDVLLVGHHIIFFVVLLGCVREILLLWVHGLHILKVIQVCLLVQYNEVIINIRAPPMQLYSIVKLCFSGRTRRSGLSKWRWRWHPPEWWRRRWRPAIYWTFGIQTGVYRTKDPTKAFHFSSCLLCHLFFQWNNNR